jgi:ABC-2 type transport system ATP-binding protein
VSAILTRGLTKHFGDARAVEELDLDVAEGEIFGFLGPNGAGKSTTIRLLVDLIRPTAGTASILGLDCRDDALAVHARIGFVAGDVALHDQLTGREHLRWLASLRGLRCDREIEALAARFRAELDRPIRALSKGNRQKVALIQAFAHRPEVVILDEPTTGLDPLMQEAFAELAREVAADGRTVFLSSHSLDEVQRLADRVGIIRAGRLVAVESVEALERSAVRHVAVRFAEPVPETVAFDDMAGVADAALDTARRSLRCTVRGDMGTFVATVGRLGVLDLVAEPADLDEIFLDYYRGSDPPAPS